MEGIVPLLRDENDVATSALLDNFDNFDNFDTCDDFHLVTAD